MGSITLHVHAERVGDTPISQNVTFYASPSLLNNPDVNDSLTLIRDIFTTEVAVPFGEDWLRRSVADKYLPSRVISPPSTPLKGPSVSVDFRREKRPSSPSISTISTPSSLTESALTESALATHTKNFCDHPVQRSRSGVKKEQAAAPQAFGIPHASTPGGQAVAAPSPPLLTLSSMVTLSSTTPSPFGSRGIGSRELSDDIVQFLVVIGKGSDADRQLASDVYHFTGRALWESALKEKLGLNPGTAKALVSLFYGL